MKSSVAMVLREAREIVRNGWCRYEFAMGDDEQPDQFCTVGALYKAAGVPFVKDEQKSWSDRKPRWSYYPGEMPRPQIVSQALMALQDAADMEVMHFTSLPNFNDYKAKNVDDVIAVFDAGINLAEEVARRASA